MRLLNYNEFLLRKHKQLKCSYKNELSTHVHKEHIIRDEFSCNECKFVATTEFFLSKYEQLKHESRARKTDIECKHCGEKFNEKWNLMDHRKLTHIQKVALCKNKLEGNCNFTADMCWWNHEETQIKNVQRLHATFAMNIIQVSYSSFDVSQKNLPPKSISKMYLFSPE